MKKVVIGLSGGIDSTYSALLLKNMGFDVIGVYLRLHDRENYFKKNMAKLDKIVDFLNIDFKILDLRESFKKNIFDNFIETYKIGETPNPCAICNRKIKFGEFFDFAINDLKADFLATGHYLKHDGKFLYQANDLSKDQSYFLFNINKNIINKLIFPLANLTKKEVREKILEIPELAFLNEERESSEICFVENKYIDTLREHISVDQIGDVINKNGEKIGTHSGYMHYTIGKRKGFSVRVAHQPHYVIDIIPNENRIVVGEKSELAVLRVSLRDINMFININEFESFVKLRYRSNPLKCKVHIENNIANIELFEPMYGLAKGQAGVFYSEDGKLLGGGWIQ